MGKIVKDLVEDTFVKKNTNIYELSILMGVDSFDFMVADSRQHLQAIRSYAMEPEMMGQPSVLNALVQGDSLLKLPYRTVKAGWVNDRSTLVPQRLYNEQKQNSYLEQSTEIGLGDAVLSDTLSSLKLQNIYTLPDTIAAFARRSFPGCRLFHITSALLEGIRKLGTAKEGPQVYAYLKGGLLFILAFEGQNLLFSNAYPTPTAKDFIYYLLLAYQQFGFKPAEAPVYLSGQLLEDSEIYREVFRYIKHIHFIDPPAFFHLGPKASQEPGHLHFDLLGLSLCG